MTPMITWFHMHGYAGYLWPAYGLVSLVLTGNLIVSLWRIKRLRSRLRSKIERF